VQPVAGQMRVATDAHGGQQGAYSSLAIHADRIWPVSSTSIMAVQMEAVDHDRGVR